MYSDSKTLQINSDLPTESQSGVVVETVVEEAVVVVGTEGTVADVVGLAGVGGPGRYTL